MANRVVIAIVVPSLIAVWGLIGFLPLHRRMMMSSQHEGLLHSLMEESATQPLVDNPSHSAGSGENINEVLPLQNNTNVDVDIEPANNSIHHFPLYGTHEFAEKCGWVLPSFQDENCVVYARQPPIGNEGVSSWTSIVASGYLAAHQMRCQFRLSYIPNINISEIFLPRQLDWTVPLEGLQCNATNNNCAIAESAYSRGGSPLTRPLVKKGNFISRIPNYRSAYGGSALLSSRELNEMRRSFGLSFDIGDSMACIFGKLFQLSPSLINYQPNLFSEIIPTLRRRPSITIYIRTGHTEHIHISERFEQYQNQSIPTIQCALRLSQPDTVWLLVTDSVHLKKWIPQRFPNRTILSTQSRGAHTKTRRTNVKTNLTTQDVVEGLLDWYLIGESRQVVADTTAPSFGKTAAFRTNRPYYQVINATSCQAMPGALVG